VTPSRPRLLGLLAAILVFGAAAATAVSALGCARAVDVVATLGAGFGAGAAVAAAIRDMAPPSAPDERRRR
jgi:hypothetical protein